MEGKGARAPLNIGPVPFNTPIECFFFFKKGVRLKSPFLREMRFKYSIDHITFFYNDLETGGFLCLNAIHSSCTYKNC